MSTTRSQSFYRLFSDETEMGFFYCKKHNLLMGISEPKVSSRLEMQYAYSDKNLEKAIYILQQYKLNVNKDISSFIRTLLTYIKNFTGNNLNVRAFFLRNTELSLFEALNYVIHSIIETEMKSNRGTDIKYDTIMLFLNFHIEKMNRLLNIQATRSTQTSLIILRGIYDSILIYFLHFLCNKFFHIPSLNQNNRTRQLIQVSFQNHNTLLQLYEKLNPLRMPIATGMESNEIYRLSNISTLNNLNTQSKMDLLSSLPSI